MAGVGPHGARQRPLPCGSAAVARSRGRQEAGDAAGTSSEGQR